MLFQKLPPETDDIIRKGEETLKRSYELIATMTELLKESQTLREEVLHRRRSAVKESKKPLSVV
jgi:hypothetical protein